MASPFAFRFLRPLYREYASRDTFLTTNPENLFRFLLQPREDVRQNVKRSRRKWGAEDGIAVDFCHERVELWSEAGSFGNLSGVELAGGNARWPDQIGQIVDVCSVGQRVEAGE